MIYPRKIKKAILGQMTNDLAIVITGMRRVWKTFLLYDLFDSIKSKNKIILDLEKSEERLSLKEESYEAVRRNLEQLGLVLTEKRPGQKIPEKKRAYLFLDEIQLFKKATSVIKYFIDHYHIKIIISGSSSFYLKNLFNESLSGRKAVFELFPLDFGEFLVFRRLYEGEWANSFQDLEELNTQMMSIKYQSLFEEYLETGGFPQAVLVQNKEEAIRLLKDIFYSYLSIDVKTLSDFKGMEELEKTVKLLPVRIGQKIDYSKLSREVGISRITLKNYLQFLNDTFVVNLIYPFSRSPDREITKAPKLYFCDSALGDVLAPISQGQRLENYVHNCLRSRFILNYYQRKSGVEIDFILNKETGLEVKVFAQKSDYRRLKRVAYDLRLNPFYVCSQKVGENIEKGIFPAFLLGFLK